LKSGYLSFINNQKSRSSLSAMYSPHPRNKWYDKNRESCTDLLHQHIALTYFLQPTTTTPPVQKDLKRNSAQFRPGQDNNNPKRE
jgi:hypothetical protein